MHIMYARCCHKEFVQMKIKTITTWADYNYGASLQAYALLTFLKVKGHDAELIKYLPPYQTRMYDYMWVNPESKASKFWITRWLYRFVKFFQRVTTLKRKKIFDDFNFKILTATNKTYSSYEELVNNPPDAELYLVGSDQVWNVLYDAGNDPAFYLEFVKNGVKASYAASFSYLEIDEKNKLRIANSLKSFKSVAVREYQGYNLLKNMGIESTWVLDPVFLLSVDDWILFAKQSTKFDLFKPYLLVYDFEGNHKLKDFVKIYAKKNGLKIYAIVDKYPILYADKNFKNAGPKEFVSLIAQCHAFVSNSFHGTAFSILFHKPFFVFNRNRHKVNSRMESLLTLFEMNDCIVSDEIPFEKYLKKQFNWKMIERIKEEQLSKSIDYLKRLGV